MTPVRTAHQSFKARYPRNLEICLSVGLLIHLAMIVFTPPMQIAPYKMEIMEDPFQMIDLEPITEIKILDPPPEVVGPAFLGEQLESLFTDDPVFVDTPEVDLNPFERPTLAGIGPGVQRHLISESGPTIVRTVQPMYPELAREAGAEGTVHVEVTVGPSGRVTRSRVIYSDTIQSLERAAVKAAEEYLFSPARQQSVAVAVRVVLEFEFSLN